MPFMFKVAILIETIRSNWGGEWAGVDDGFYTLSLLDCARLVLLLVRSRRIPALFFNFIFLFRDGVCPGSSVLGFSSGGLVTAFAGTASSLSSPSVLPTPVTISCLLPYSPCVLACRVRAGCLGSPIVKRRHFCVHGYHFLRASTGCEVDCVCVLVLGRQKMPSLVSGVLFFPTNI